MLRLIGDVHGHFDAWRRIAAGAERSVQVGDFGAGFAPLPESVAGRRFIRGNHDDPALCRASPDWIPDGTVEDGILFVGGGESTDRLKRIPGRDWWPDEELSLPELSAIIDRHAAETPRVVVSHDGPSVATAHFTVRRKDSSRTSQALDAMLALHAPALWVFGHWHLPLDTTIGPTRFICLPELAFFDLD